MESSPTLEHGTLFYVTFGCIFIRFWLIDFSDKMIFWCFNYFGFCGLYSWLPHPFSYFLQKHSIPPRQPWKTSKKYNFYYFLHFLENIFTRYFYSKLVISTLFPNELEQKTNFSDFTLHSERPYFDSCNHIFWYFYKFLKILFLEDFYFSKKFWLDILKKSKKLLTFKKNTI